MNHTTSPPPETLVARIKQGDTSAEHELIKQFSRGIMTMLTRRCGDRLLAEDLHQDTFIIVLGRLREKGIDEPARLPGFIHQTAKFVWIAHLRKRKRRGLQYDTERIEITPDVCDGPLQDTLRYQSQDAVRLMIDAITNDNYRELLRRRYVLEQSKKEICDALDMDSRAYDRTISRARAKFRSELLRSGANDRDGGQRP